MHFRFFYKHTHGGGEGGSQKSTTERERCIAAKISALKGGWHERTGRPFDFLVPKRNAFPKISMSGGLFFRCALDLLILDVWGSKCFWVDLLSGFSIFVKGWTGSYSSLYRTSASVIKFERRGGAYFRVINDFFFSDFEIRTS